MKPVTAGFANVVTIVLKKLRSIAVTVIAMASNEVKLDAVSWSTRCFLWEGKRALLSVP